MRPLRAFFHRLRGLFNADRQEREFSAELESHLAMHIDDYRRSGLSEDEARRQAIIKLGGIEQAKERYRERRRVPVVETALKDMRFALRLMRRNPGFTAIILITLAIGIGANSVMFSVVNTVLLRPLPYEDPDLLVSVRTVDKRNQAPAAASPPDFYIYRDQNRTFAKLDAFYTRPSNLTGDPEPERVQTLIVSSGFFTTLGMQPALGRAFIPNDEKWGSHRVVILSDGLWRRRFSGNPAIVGQYLTLDGEPFLVAGVLPSTFSFLGIQAQVIVPMAFEAGDNMNSRNNYFLRMVGRMQADASITEASADLNRLSDAIIAQYSLNENTAIEVTPFRDALVAGTRRPVLVLLGAVGFVLLIACANLANLLLARAVVRQREIAVRLAMGASRARLLRQFLIESVLLSLLGGALGLGLAYFSADALNLISLQVLPRAEQIRVDPRVLTFTFGIAMVTGILLGLAPALHGVGTDVVEGLKDSTRGASDTRARHRLRGSLVVVEVALSLVLLVGAGLMVKSMYRLLNVDAGFQPDNVLTMQINLPRQSYVDEGRHRRFDPQAYAKATAFFSAAIENLRSIPGAQAAGAINGLPLMGDVWGKFVTFYDRPLPADFRALPPIQYRVVVGDYFRALGIRLRSGRLFTDRDTLESPKVAIVNREMVRRHYENVDPVGQLIGVNPPLQLLPKDLVEQARKGGLPDNYEPARLTIVGVVDDVLYAGLDRSPVPVVYVPYAQGSEGTTNMFMVVRAAGDPLTLVGAVRQQIAEVDSNQPVANIQTMTARVSASVAQPRLQMNVLASFAALAALLAAIGIYGVMSYTVTHRSRDIGIRLALGARRREVMAWVLRQASAMVVAGVVLGVGAALLLTRVLQSLLFGVSATDPAVFVGIVVILSMSAWLASYFPARRAARLDPLTTLRNE